MIDRVLADQQWVQLKLLSWSQSPHSKIGQLSITSGLIVNPMPTPIIDEAIRALDPASQ